MRNLWLTRLDAVRDLHDLDTDRQLAALLGITPQSLSTIRQGGNLSAVTKLKILDQLGGWSLREALEESLGVATRDECGADSGG